MRTPSTPALVLAAAIAASAISPSASAQSSSTAADALFKEGRAAMDQKDYPTACARFEASQKEEPSSSTLLNLGQCYEKREMFASAWGTYNAAARAARLEKHDDFVQGATGLAKALEPKLIRLKITVSDAATSRKGLTILRDGAAISDGERGVAIPIDKGHHDVEADAPGAKPWKTSIEADGTTNPLEVTIPALEDDPNAVPAPSASAFSSTTPGPLENPPPPATQKSTWQVPTALALGTAGVIGVAIGVIEGLSASSKLSNLKSTCGPSYPACPKGTDDGPFETAATVSDVGFIAGGILLAGGAVIYFTRPKDGGSTASASSPSVGLSPSLGRMSVVGRF